MVVKLQVIVKLQAMVVNTPLLRVFDEESNITQRLSELFFCSKFYTNSVFDAVIFFVGLKDI